MLTIQLKVQFSYDTPDLSALQLSDQADHAWLNTVNMGLNDHRQKMWPMNEL